MSYEKVKYVSIKNQTITSACNNLRPLYYETWKAQAESKEDFVKKVLIDFLDGNFQGRSKALYKFNHTIYIYHMVCEKENELYDKRWNNYDYKTNTYRYGENACEEATEELKDILWNIFQKVDAGYKWNAWDGWVKS